MPKIRHRVHFPKEPPELKQYAHQYHGYQYVSATNWILALMWKGKKVRGILLKLRKERANTRLNWTVVYDVLLVEEESLDFC